MKDILKFFKIISVIAIISFAVLFAFSVRADDTEEVNPDNGIPVVYLNIDESQGTIEEMLESADHSVYCSGTVTITVPEGFHYADFPDTACVGFENLEMSIRGRGNSTWRQSKKPFKIKLDKKADIFGLGANKHWALLANINDESLVRDRITGSHTLAVIFDDGKVETDFTVRQSGSSTSPETGDSGNISFWLFILFAALTGILAIYVHVNKTNK